VAPYWERTYLRGDVGGRVLLPGLFTRSLDEPRTVPLLASVGGADGRQVGNLTATEDRVEGLFCRFTIMDGPAGDQVLSEVAGGYYPAFEPAYVVVNQGRGDSGSIEVTEARLHHVSLVAVGAFESARAATGRAAELDDLLAPFRNGPRVDLSPLPAFR
jgi:HK97 family phage prohead protease